MVLDRLAEAAREAERKFGLPPLSKFVETVEKLPDERRLKLIKEVLVVAERVSQTAPELDKVIGLIREINSIPIEKLNQLEKVLKRIEGIIKKAPQELLSFLTTLKEE
jgi:DNA-binding transcriptional regulator GbsR (MarR family)